MVTIGACVGMVANASAFVFIAHLHALGVALTPSCAYCVHGIQRLIVDLHTQHLLIKNKAVISAQSQSVVVESQH